MSNAYAFPHLVHCVQDERICVLVAIHLTDVAVIIAALGLLFLLRLKWMYWFVPGVNSVFAMLWYLHVWHADWLESLPSVFAIFAVFGLAILGGYVTVNPPTVEQRALKRRYVISFIVLGAIGFVANVLEIRSEREKQTEMLDQITGGGQFCYLDFGAWGSVGKTNEIGIRLAVKNSGPLPLPRCYVEMYKRPDANGNLHPPPLLEKDFGPLQPRSQSAPISAAFPSGFYAIYISTRDHEYLETIDIEPSKQLGLAKGHAPPQIASYSVLEQDTSGNYKKQVLRRP